MVRICKYCYAMRKSVEQNVVSRIVAVLEDRFRDVACAVGARLLQPKHKTSDWLAVTNTLGALGQLATSLEHHTHKRSSDRGIT